MKRASEPELSARYEAAVAAWKAKPSAGALPDFAVVRAAAHERMAAPARGRGWRAGFGWGGVRLWGGLGGLAAVAVVVALVAWPRGAGVGDALPLRFADEGAGAGAGAGPGAGTVTRGSGPGSVVEAITAETELAVGVSVTSTEALTLVDPATARLTLAAASRMRIDAWDGALAEVRLEVGAVTADVRKRAPSERFEVRTAQAVVRVVGTKFAVRVLGDATEIETYEGLVRVERPSGELVAMVAAGERVRVSARAAVVPESARPDVAEAAVPAEPRVEANAGQAGVGAVLEGGKRVAAETVAPAEKAVERDGLRDVKGAAMADAAVFDEARALLASGQDAAAIAKIEGALTTPNPQAARLYALLGDARRLVGRYDDARKSYEQALAMTGAPPSVIVDLTRLLEKELGRPADAAKQWARFVAAHPRDPKAAFGLAEEARIVAAGGGDGDRILARIVAEYGQTPEATRALIVLGRHLLDAADWEAAATLFAGAIDAADPARGEAAIVGLMRARLAQGRASDVRALGADYARRFPSGARRDEVARIVGALE